MAVSTLTNHETEVFSGRVMHGYSLTDLFGSSKMQYFGMKPTNSINQPIVIEGTAQFVDDDTDHSGIQDSTIDATAIPLFANPLKSVDRIKRRSVDERPDLDLLRNYGIAQGKAVGKGKTLAIMQYLAQEAIALGNTIEVDTSSGGGVKNAFKEVAGELDTREVDVFGRHAMLKSTLWYELHDEDGVISRDFGGQANRQSAGGNMDVINYLNIDIANVGLAFGTDYSDTALDIGYEHAEDMTDVVGIVWQEQAWALREQVQPETSGDWLPEFQVWQVLTRFQFGCKTLIGDETGTGGPAADALWILIDATA